MGWRTAIGNFLERFDKPASTVRTIPDPFNSALDYTLNTGDAPVAIVAALQQAFPALSTQQATSLVSEAQALGHQALLTYYDVRDGLLTEAEAETQLKAACPQMDAFNFSRLRAKCHMAASK